MDTKLKTINLGELQMIKVEINELTNLCGYKQNIVKFYLKHLTKCTERVPYHPFY